MDDEAFLALGRRSLPASSRWSLRLDRGDRGFRFVAEHPASAGLVLEIGTFETGVAVEHLSQWLRQREIVVADAAPELAHPNIVMGVRALAAAFEWPTVQVGGVAFLLFEAGALTADEAAWLSGFVANDAPMKPRSPVGGSGTMGGR